MSLMLAAVSKRRGLRAVCATHLPTSRLPRLLANPARSVNYKSVI